MTNISYADVINSKDLVPILQNEKTKYVAIKSLVEKIANNIPGETKEFPQEKCCPEYEKLKVILDCYIKKVDKALLVLDKAWKITQENNNEIAEQSITLNEVKDSLRELENLNVNINSLITEVNSLKTNLKVEVTTDGDSGYEYFNFFQGTDILCSIQVPKSTRYAAGANIKIQNNIISVTGLGKAALTNKYEDLSYKPTIATKTSELDNDANFITMQQSENYTDEQCKIATTEVKSNQDNYHVIVNKGVNQDGANLYTVVENDIASASALNQEISDARAAENTNALAISAEVSRATSKENSLQNALNQEKLVRATADEQLDITVTENTNDNTAIKSYTIVQGTNTLKGTIKIPKIGESELSNEFVQQLENNELAIAQALIDLNKRLVLVEQAVANS